MAAASRCSAPVRLPSRAPRAPRAAALRAAPRAAGFGYDEAAALKAAGSFAKGDNGIYMRGPPPAPTLVPKVDMYGDPMNLLLSQRIVFLGSDVNDFTADAVVSQLLLLDAQDPTKDIRLYINSPGGSVTAGMGVYDAMQMCRCDIQTVCFGLAASMGAFLLCAGTKGKRMSLPNSRIMIHQPLGGASGQAVDIEIQAKEIMYHKANLNNLMSFHSGQPVDKVEEDTDRDRYMSPAEAKDYGLIDVIIGGEDGVVAPYGAPAEQKTKSAYVSWGLVDDED